MVNNAAQTVQLNCKWLKIEYVHDYNNVKTEAAIFFYLLSANASSDMYNLVYSEMIHDIDNDSQYEHISRYVT